MQNMLPLSSESVLVSATWAIAAHGDSPVLFCVHFK